MVIECNVAHQCLAHIPDAVKMRCFENIRNPAAKALYHSVALASETDTSNPCARKPNTYALKALWAGLDSLGLSSFKLPPPWRRKLRSSLDS